MKPISTAKSVREVFPFFTAFAWVWFFKKASWEGVADFFSSWTFFPEWLLFQLDFCFGVTFVPLSLRDPKKVFCCFQSILKTFSCKHWANLTHNSSKLILSDQIFEIFAVYIKKKLQFDEERPFVYAGVDHFFWICFKRYVNNRRSRMHWINFSRSFASVTEVLSRSSINKYKTVSWRLLSFIDQNWMIAMFTLSKLTNENHLESLAENTRFCKKRSPI